MAVNLGQAYGRIVIDSSAAVAGFNRAGAAGASFTKTLAGLGVGVVVGKALTSTVSAASDFNQALADLNAVADISATQLQALSAQALKAGQATRFSATEAAQGQIELAKAGLTAQQILDGGLDTALALAAAGNMEVAQAAETAANAVQLFGLQGSDLTSVADAMAIAANRTTADVSDFAAALQQGGSAAKQVGLGFKDTVTALEALALQGVKGSDAGTSLKAALLSLAAPIGSGAKAMKQYGLEFFKANGEVKDFTGIAQELESKLGGLTQKQRTQVLQAIAGRDGFRVLAAAYDLGAKKSANLRKELDQQGKAAEVAAKRQDSLRGDVEQLGGSIETLQIKAASGAVPALRAMAQAATGAINAIASGGGDLGEFFGGLADAGQGVASTLGNVVGIALQAGQAIGSVVAPIVAFTGAVVGSEAGVKVLTAAVVGLSAAYLANRAAAVALFAVQRAQAVFQAAQAFIHLAASVRTAGEAMALLRAATLASPVGLLAAGVGAAAAAVVLLSGAFRSGPSAAEQQKQALDRVKNAANEAAGGLDRAREAADKLTSDRLAATQAALNVEQAERSYQQAVQQSGAASLEARQAENQLAQARLQLKASTDAAAKSTKATASDIGTEIQRKVRLRAENLALINSLEQQIAVTRRFGGNTAEAQAKIRGMEEQIVKLRGGFDRAHPAIQALQKQALAAAASLEGETAPAARKAREDLLAIGNAKPKELPGVVNAIKSGTSKGKAAAQSGAAEIRSTLQNVDTTVLLGSFIGSIATQGARAVAVAAAQAARVRAALSSANADVRNSPSANDLMRRSLSNMANITEAGLKQTQAVARRGADGLLNERVKLEQRLAALDRAAELRERKKQGTVRRGRIEDRIAGLGRISTDISDVESGANDIGARIGDALDRALAKSLAQVQANYDASIAAIAASPEAQRLAAIDAADQSAETNRRQQEITDAQAKVQRLQGVLARARTDSERAAAQLLLDQAAAEANQLAGTFQVDQERQRLTAILEARRVAAEQQAEQQRQQAEAETADRKAQIQRELGDLAEKLRAGQITAKKFNQQVAAIVGDPKVRAALQDSGEELGLAFIRGLQRTQRGVANAAKDLAASVAAYLKMRSPAEKGPLAFDFRRSGRVIGNDISAGLAASRSRVEREASLVAGAAAVSGEFARGAGGLTQYNTIQVTNPVEDALALTRRLYFEAKFGAVSA